MMAPKRIQAEVVVIGAGTTGAATAMLLAREGRRVVLLERQSLSGAGGRWINAVPPWMFDQAGISQPDEDEIDHRGAPMVFLGPEGQARLELAETPLWDLHMERLIDRLQRGALDAGVQAFEGVRLAELEGEAGRPRRLRFTGRPFGEPGGGPADMVAEAALFVDASGRAQALRERLPDLAGGWPLVPAEHTCTAAQFTCAIADRAGAETFCERHRIEPGTTLAFGCPEGGWSILDVRVAADLESVYLLAGCIATDDRPTGDQMLAAFCRFNPWIGARLTGGGGLIRLRRPYDRLAAAGVALVGEAGCQVFGLHGSGTGNGLLAARALAEATADHADPGAEEVTWAYQTAFQRGPGAVSAAYDVMRRMLARMAPAEVERLMVTGLLNEGIVFAGLDQRLPGPGVLDLTRMPKALATDPALAMRLAPTLARLGSLYTTHRAFPGRPGEWALKRFSGLTARLAGDPPDLAN